MRPYWKHFCDHPFPLPPSTERFDDPACHQLHPGGGEPPADGLLRRVGAAQLQGARRVHREQERAPAARGSPGKKGKF